MLSNPQDVRQQILNYVTKENYSPVKAAKLAEKLGITKSDLQEFKDLIKNMVKEGSLVHGSKHVLKAAEEKEKNQAQSRFISGTYYRKGEQFGIVRQPELEKTKENEIVINGDDCADASDGDTVNVALDKKINRKGQRVGRVVEIVARKTQQFVGTYSLIGSSSYVIVDGNLFDNPIWVGDAQSKKIEPNTKVVIEMVRFPQGLRQGEGVITEVLGPRGTPEADTLSVIRRYGLPDKFSDEVAQYVRTLTARYSDIISPERTDLTQKYIITIDPEDAQDYDDAISIERLPDGSVILGVHIADVSYFVDENSVLDTEARNRGNSVYLPDRVLPMLPEQICNGMASLQPGKNRYCKSVLMEFNPEGIRTNVEIKNSVIKSSERLTYEQVDEYFATGKASIQTETCRVLDDVRKLALILRHRRDHRGCLHLSLPEIKILYNNKGEITGVRKENSTESHLLIEEFMVSANEAVAEYLVQHGETFIRRIHLPPVPKKLARFDRFVQELGITEINGSDRMRMQDVLQKTVDTVLEFPVHQAALRAMQKAEYSPSSDGHFALASDCYCHFTSPIRRYADLTIHRLLQAILTGTKPNRHLDQITLLGQHLTDTEDRAENAERDLTELKIAQYMETKVGQEITAMVSGTSKNGVFVQGIEIPVEAMLPISALPRDEYYFEDDLQMLSGYKAENCFRLGDKLLLKIKGVKYLGTEPRIEFELIKFVQRVVPLGQGGKPLSAGAQKANRPGKPDNSRTPFDWTVFTKKVKGKFHKKDKVGGKGKGKGKKRR